MKYILLFISIFFMLACTTTKPTITEFKLDVQTDNVKRNSLGCKEKTLKISKAFSEPSLMSLKMDYVEDKNKVFSYSQSQWVISPAEAISKEMFFSLRDSELFKHVNLDISRSNSEYIMEITIEDFIQYYNKKLDTSYVVVKLNINVIDIKDSSIVASKNFSSKVSTKTLDAEGGVQALNKALSDVIYQNVQWLSGVCK